MRTIYTITWTQWSKDGKGPATQESLSFTSKDSANYHAGLMQDDKLKENIQVIKHYANAK